MRVPAGRRWVEDTDEACAARWDVADATFAAAVAQARVDPAAQLRCSQPCVDLYHVTAHTVHSEAANSTGLRRLRRDDARLRLAGLDEAQPQLVENLLEQLPFLGRQVAAGLRLEQRQDVDHLLRGGKIRLGRLSAHRIRDI